MTLTSSRLIEVNIVSYKTILDTRHREIGGTCPTCFSSCGSLPRVVSFLGALSGLCYINEGNRRHCGGVSRSVVASLLTISGVLSNGGSGDTV